nr:MAG TPA: hypothetical protein [Caudoviricetes sp.]
MKNYASASQAYSCTLPYRSLRSLCYLNESYASEGYAIKKRKFN